MRRGNPRSNRLSRLLGDLKLHRPLRLPLHDNRAGRNMATWNHIVDAKPNQVAPAKLAVDSEIEQRQFAVAMIEL